MNSECTEKCSIAREREVEGEIGREKERKGEGEGGRGGERERGRRYGREERELGEEELEGRGREGRLCGGGAGTNQLCS